MCSSIDDISESLSIFQKNTNNPEIYLQSQDERSADFKCIAKLLYDDLLQSEPVKSTALPKLYTEGFDGEQIWQQIELQNKHAITQFAKSLSKMELDHLQFGVKGNTPIAKTVSFSKDILDDPSSNEEEYAFDDDSDSSVELPKQSIDSVKKLNSSTSKSSEVDDQFFKLSQLEQFLRIEDLKEEQEKEESDEDIDLFQDVPSDEDQHENELIPDEHKTSASSFMYEDFFDPPESEDESILNTHEELADGSNEKEYDTRDYDPTEESKQDETSCALDKHGDSLQDKIQEKTAFQLEQEKVRKRIKECEAGLLAPLSWHLTGEVSASKRPVNSLVQKETDFESTAKPELLVDTNLTERTESIIKMAIINKAWHDVERKVKTQDEQITYKREAMLEQTQSKKSLAEVYEEEFMKKQYKKEEKEDPKHVEIKKLMDSLFPELYALFSHIPKPPVPEMKVVSNMPAVTVEEVAPTTLTDAALLAPEEVKKKSGEIKAATEMTDTDRKRSRRKKKLLQKLKYKEQEKKGPKSGRLEKKEKLKVLKKLKQNKNTKIAEVDVGGKIKSSRDFFSRLQDTVQSNVAKKKKKS